MTGIVKPAPLKEKKMSSNPKLQKQPFSAADQKNELELLDKENSA